MQTRRKKAGLVLGAVFLLIPGRWAAAAEEPPAAPYAPPVEGSTPPVQSLPPPAPVWAPELLARAEGPMFYDYVGRPDLRDRYETRQTAKNAVRIIGGVIFSVGFVELYVRNFANFFCAFADPSCHFSQTVPALLTGGGLALMLAPGLVRSDPVSDDEKLELARDAVDGSHRHAAPMDLALAPRIDRDGASLAVMGRY
jgi:hypothetical protein